MVLPLGFSQTHKQGLKQGKQTMVQCDDCGAPCGRRNRVDGIFNNDRFLCDKCASKRRSDGLKAFGGFLFLCLGVGLSAVVICTVLKPIAASYGYDCARGLSIGLGVGGVVLYFIFRFIADKTKGCLVRMIVKFVGFIAYALGVGLLFFTFLMGKQFKTFLGVKDPSSDATTESNAPTEEARQQ